MGITINLVTLYDTFGMPKFTMEFAARIMQDPATTYLFLAVILVVTRCDYDTVIVTFIITFIVTVIIVTVIDIIDMVIATAVVDYSCIL
jgi:hypothetical protein